MWEEIMRLAIGNGLWAVLFCCLLVYLLRDSRARETKYQGTINGLVERLSLLADVAEKADKICELQCETIKIVKSKKGKAETPEKVAV